MGNLIRGCKNAFRNAIRTVSVVLILAISIGLALVMLLSYRTVQGRISSIKTSIGTTVTVTPAGAQGFQGGGTPLTNDQASIVAALPHVTGTVSSIGDRLTPTTDTSLQTAIDAGTLGSRFNQQNLNAGGDTNQTPPAGATTKTRTFTVPITVTGISDPSVVNTSPSKLTSGALFTPGSTADVAILGTGLASKNSLTVGSTFTAYSKTITVVGIYDAGSTFANAGMYMPLSTLQTLSTQTDSLTQITATVDTIDNVSGVVSSLKSALGSAADVASTEDQANTAIAPLENIKSISLYSLIGALVAGSIITLLTMIMIVRERRREIGVLKAIGQSNIGVVMQFISESLVLTLLGGLVGVALGALLSNPILSVLVSSNSATAAASPSPSSGFGGGRGFGRAASQLGGQAASTLKNASAGLHAAITPEILLYGILAAVAIAVLGSAIPAFLIAKVKPAEVMRAE